jgi:hypothetical protein
MSTRPNNTDAPVPLDWAEDGAALVENPAPSLAVRQVGWTPVTPTANRFNWLLRAMSRQLEYLMNFKADVTAGDRWGYDDTTVLPTISMRFAPHTWRVISGTQDTSVAIPSATPARLQPSTTAAMIAVRDFTVPQIAGSTGIARLKTMRVRWRCVNVSDTITVSLYKQPTQASGNPELVAVLSASGGYASLSNESTSVDVELNGDYFYFLTAVLDANATPSDVQLSSVVLEMTKSSVE